MAGVVCFLIVDPKPDNRSLSKGLDATTGGHLPPSVIKLFAPPEDMGLPDIDHAELAAFIGTFGRDEAVCWLSRVAQVLHFTRESSAATQHSLVAFAYGPAAGVRAHALVEHEDMAIFTHEGVLRLIFLVLNFAERRPAVLVPSAVERLLVLSPYVNAMAYTTEALENPTTPDATMVREASLAMFLAANMPGSSEPEWELLFDVWMAALIAHELAADAGALATVDARIVKATGHALLSWHVALLEWATTFKFLPDAEGITMDQHRDVVPVPTAGSLPNTIGELKLRLLHALAVPDAGALPDTLQRVRSPRSCWGPYSWRPFHVFGPSAVCWDVRTLHSMCGLHFPKAMQAVLGHADDDLLRVWNGAVERAIERLGSAHSKRFARIANLPGGKGQKVADWVAWDDDDVMVVEFKNALPPDSTFKDPNVDYFESWLHSRFFEDEGFPQAYATIDRCTKERWKTPDGRAFNDFRGVWPIVVVGMAFSHLPDVHVRVVREAEPLSRTVRASTPSLRFPLIFSLSDFLSLLAAIDPVGPQHDRIGALLGAFVDKGIEDEWSFSGFLTTRHKGHPRPTRISEVADAAMVASIKRAEALR